MVVDASVWVSSLIAGDALHRPSADWLTLQVAAGATLVVPALVLAEVAGAVSRRTGRPELGHQAVLALRAVPGIELVYLDDTLAADAARLAADLRLRGADAIYIAVAAARQLSLITWDRELLERTPPVVAVSSP